MKKVDHGRGAVKDDALAALVTSKVFRPKREESVKAYNRKQKHRNQFREPCQKREVLTGLFVWKLVGLLWVGRYRRGVWARW
ncbi:alternative ribosome rescue factor ArfA [Ferrimonas marina]|uniref:Stalled ribosome alternative rescue factor ArfA n=1 Tax=Ferrimonas marina TaxID=299255 RepID=A0A1M5U796_9GAMM|nr:alternative ribosome rescue factor ArfA [Ferrimonas marina]SHH58935.1 Stalled ribosome alternative rescue factor ArfA [Ferrimonas marina]